MISKKERMSVLIFEKQIEKAYRAQMFSRQEVFGAIFYFSAKVAYPPYTAKVKYKRAFVKV